MQIKEKIDGIVIGILQGFDNGMPLVAFAENLSKHPIPARALVELRETDKGCEVALQFEQGHIERPLILGRIVAPGEADSPHVVSDGKRVRVTGQERIELRCGKASIIMEADGHITIRGSYLVNHASASNRIRGGSVNIN